MAIVFTPADRMESIASWHMDEDLCKSQAAKLGEDLIATIDRLVGEALVRRLGYVPSVKECGISLEERTDPETTLVWVCWNGKAIAVRTEPRSEVRDCRYYLSFYWKNLNDRN